MIICTQYPQLGRYWADNHRECVDYAHLLYEVGFIQKYWYLTNLWAKIDKIWCVCPNMGRWFLAHNSVIFCSILMTIHIRVQGPLATSRALTILVMSMLWWFGIIGTKNGRGCPTGTSGHPESRTPSKVWSQALVCWPIAIYKSNFTKKLVNFGPLCIFSLISVDCSHLVYWFWTFAKFYMLLMATCVTLTDLTDWSLVKNPVKIVKFGSRKAEIRICPTGRIGNWSKFQSKPWNFGQEDYRKAPLQKSSKVSLCSDDFSFIKAFFGNRSFSA